MKKTLTLLALVLAVLAAVFSCERRPLEIVYKTGVRVVVQNIWEADAYPEGEKPTGVTLFIFKEGQFHSQLTTSNIDSLEVQLEAGHYQLYVMSQSPEEYWKQQFRDLTKFNDAASVLRTKTLSWVRLRSASDVVVEDPESVCIGLSKEFDVTEETQEQYQYYYNGWRNRKRTLESLHTKADEETDPELAEWEAQMNFYTIRVPVYPKNVTSQFWVTIYSGNADVLRSVRSSTSGMAREYMLTQGTTGAAEATQVITQWKLTMDNVETRVGHLDGIITTFGLPNGETPSIYRDSTLNVSTLLIDNQTEVDYVFKVGDMILKGTPDNGYRNLLRLILGDPEHPAITPPDVEPESGGGFTAGVSDWEEEVHGDIPI